MDPLAVFLSNFVMTDSTSHISFSVGIRFGAIEYFGPLEVIKNKYQPNWTMCEEQEFH